MVSLRSRALLLILLLPAGCDAWRGAPRAVSPKAPEAVRRLFVLMRDRLVLMHEVARSKWSAGRPVADPEREKALLGAMEERGRALGLDPAEVRDFFTAQLEAAKQVQEADVQRWRAEGRGPFAGAPDLGDLRRRIDRLNLDLIAALADGRPLLRDEAARKAVPGWAREVIVGEGIDDGVRAAAVAPLVKRDP